MAREVGFATAEEEIGADTGEFTLIGSLEAGVEYQPDFRRSPGATPVDVDVLRVGFSPMAGEGLGKLLSDGFAMGRVNHESSRSSGGHLRGVLAERQRQGDE